MLILILLRKLNNFEVDFEEVLKEFEIGIECIEEILSDFDDVY